MKAKHIFPLIFLLALGGILACNSDKEEPQDNNIQISENSFEMNYGETHQLTAQFRRDGYNSNQLVWSSSNPQIASVQNGLVTGNRVGEAIITVQTSDQLFSATSQVKVHATNFLFTEPLLNFGQSRDFIKSNEVRELVDEDEDYLYFSGENEHILLVGYGFTESVYTEAFVLLNPSVEVESQTLDFLHQRYELVGEDDEWYWFSDNETVVFMLTVEEMGLMLFYFEDEEGGSAVSKLDRIKNYGGNLIPTH